MTKPDAGAPSSSTKPPRDAMSEKPADQPAAQVDETVDNTDADYFSSELHINRLTQATDRTVKSLIAISSAGDIWYGISECMGILYGCAGFMKQMGMKNLWPKIHRDLFRFMKSGT